jgi:hypothetical protein
MLSFFTTYTLRFLLFVHPVVRMQFVDCEGVVFFKIKKYVLRNTTHTASCHACLDPLDIFIAKTILRSQRFGTHLRFCLPTQPRSTDGPVTTTSWAVW